MQGVHVGHVKHDRGIYIGRAMPGRQGSVLGNPFNLKRYTLEESLARYRRWLWDTPEALEALPTLRGQTVVCWCRTLSGAGHACHGDVINAALEKLSDDQIRARAAALRSR